MRLAHSMADTLVTPLNDSFVDFDVLGTVDPQTFAVTGISHYAEMVREARRQRRIVDGCLDRLDRGAQPPCAAAVRATSALVGDSLDRARPASSASASPRASRERVVYREFFPRGLTALDHARRGDARHAPQPVARRRAARGRRPRSPALKLPIDERGRRGPRRAPNGSRLRTSRLRSATSWPIDGRRRPIARLRAERPLMWLGTASARDEQSMTKDRSEGAPAPANRDRPATPSAKKSASRAEIDAFVTRARSLAIDGAARPERPPDLRARRHHEPAADLGRGMPAAGRHVPRSGERSAVSMSSSSIIAVSANAAPRTGCQTPSGSPG